MEKLFGKKLFYYNTFILFLLSCCVSYGIYFYWSKGPVNIENINNIFNASSKIDQLKEKNGFEGILKLVKNHKIRPAVKIVNSLEKNTKNIGQDFYVESFDGFTTDLRTLDKRLHQLLSYPGINSVFTVLLKKISNFEDFVVTRNWRSLTRISKRLKTKVAIGKSSSLTNLRIKKLIRTVQKDVKMMSTLTKGSILRQSDKDSVLKKLNTFNIEIDMLNRYLAVIKNFNKDFRNINKSYHTWINDLGPTVTLQKIEFESHSQNFLFALIIFLSFILLSMITGFFIFKSSSKNISSNAENLILDVVKETLIPTNPNYSFDMSHEFESELEKFREYLHKRMSFGSIFQDAMPFSSILLDSNLNLVWANSIFYDNWGMKSKKNSDDNITWDYIQQSTNLGVNDPVVSAISEKIAGIYQIQVKTSLNKESIPYEMYVSPVSYADQTRVMIIFYPLHSMEETLIHQTQSLVGPISRTLDAFSSGSFDSNFVEKIRKDFEVANIINILDQFEVLNKLQTDEKGCFISNLQGLENENFDYQKILSDISNIHKEKFGIYDNTKDTLLSTKDSIVDLVGLRQSLEEIFVKVSSLSENILADEFLLLDKVKKAFNKIEKYNSNIDSLNTVSEELKEAKSNIDSVRSKIASGIEGIRSNKRSEQITSKLAEDFLDFEKYMRTFSKVIINLEGSLAKSNNDLEFDNEDSFEEKFNLQLQINKEALDRQMFEGNTIIEKAFGKDEEMVNSLGQLYSFFEKSRKKSMEISPLLES